MGQEAKIRIGHEKIDWISIRKEVHQSCILPPCLFNLYAEFIMQKAGLNESETGIKIVRRKSKNFTATMENSVEIPLKNCK